MKRIEPVLALYVFTSFLKFSVFNALLHEKSCIFIYKVSILVFVNMRSEKAK